jgi:hypothetical protein
MHNPLPLAHDAYTSVTCAACAGVQWQEALQRLAKGESLVDVARTYGVDPTTIGRLQGPFRFGEARPPREATAVNNGTCRPQLVPLHSGFESLSVT